MNKPEEFPPERLIKVLLVDRYALVREGLQHILMAANDIDVVGQTGNGAEVIKLAPHLEPDVIMLDAGLPGVEEVTHHLSTELPEVKTLILAAECLVQQVLNLLSVGATGYLCKDATGEELLAAVRLVSLGEMVLDPAVAKIVVDHLTHRQSQLLSHSISLPELLTEREIEVLRLLCRGQTDKEIAEELFISLRTVNGHLRHIYGKLGVHTRTEAMRLALEKGWATLPEKQ
jgi:DNA-binding NarL/FixJ family response regulator